MKIKYILFLPIFFLLIFSTPIVYAVSSTDYIQHAQKFIYQICITKNLSGNVSLLCYLYNKVQEQDITLSNHEKRITNLEATVTPISGKISNLQNHQSQDEQQATNLNQQVQALSASVKALPTPINWDITGTYTLRVFPITNSPDARIITISTVDSVTGQFSGTGSHSGNSLTVSGIVNGSQFTLQTQAAGSIDIQVQGSISPDGKLWGVGVETSDGHGFVMTTLSGAAAKKN